MICAVNKEFSICANFSKGRREHFREWIETNHPGALLLHIEISSWSRQYLAVKGSGLVYINCLYWIEFLGESIRTPGDNIIQENIFIILSSLEMTVLARFCGIIYITICMLTRWLSGKYHILSYCNWSVRSMG